MYSYNLYYLSVGVVVLLLISYIFISTIKKESLENADMPPPDSNEELLNIVKNKLKNSQDELPNMLTSLGLRIRRLEKSYVNLDEYSKNDNYIQNLIKNVTLLNTDIDNIKMDIRNVQNRLRNTQMQIIISNIVIALIFIIILIIRYLMF